MGWERNSAYAGRTSRDWKHLDASLAATTLYVVGWDDGGADETPGARYSGDVGNAFRTVTVRNTGTTTLHVAADPILLRIDGEYAILEPNETVTLTDVAGFAVYNSHASTAGVWDAAGELSREPNRDDSASDPGHTGAAPEHSCKVTATANAAVTDTITVQWDLTVTAIKLYPARKTEPASAAGTYTLAITGAGNNLHDSATFDLEGITAATVESINLTATSADLNLDKGDTISLVSTSNNADLTNGDYYVRIEATAR